MKLLSKLTLFILTTFIFSSCSKEENEITKDNSLILGSWSETSIVEENYVSMTMEIIWTFNENNTASQEITLKLNNLTYKNIKNYYSYIYNEELITFSDQNNKIWTYEIYVSNNKMRLGNEENGYFNLTKIPTSNIEQQSNNEIRYTSSSNSIIYPYKNNPFNANIVSNQYLDNYGIITLSKDLETIYDDAFRGIYELTTISLPSSIASIGKYAFYKCTNLKECKIPHSLRELGKSAFQDCENLLSIEIPNNITSIKQGTFYGCKSLINITMPTSLKTIENAAFAYCANLKKIEIPNNVSELGSMAFCGCNKLTTISIPESIKAIKSFTFSSCKNLVEIILPTSITNIEENAFYGSQNLESIYCYSEEPPHIIKSIGSGTGTFNGFSKKAKIFVPQKSINKYKEQWQEVTSQIYSIN